MKFFLGNLLFILCLITANQSAFSQTSLTEDYETIPATFVQIDRVQGSRPTTVSIIQTATQLTTIIGQKAYSLLKWNSFSRRSALEIPNYDRKSQFGTWINEPNDGVCFNTRAKVLIRDSAGKVVMRETNNCVVDQGLWYDPYTDQNYTNASDIQIDHMVPLKNTYISGGHRWNNEVRCLYANYMGLKEHLLSVNASENMRKSDRTPADYIPPNEKYVCTYLKNWLRIKFIWGLELTVKEAQSIREKMTQYNCSTSSFTLSQAEFKRQVDYAKANRDLCAKANPASN